jgi:hypothetical protein
MGGALGGSGCSDRNEITMAGDQPVDVRRVACQARPAASRHGWRDDDLCASMASMIVAFRGVEITVCQIHEKTYARWGADARGNAALLRGWPREGPSTH